jgi:large subunit ribosomal protein L25
MDTDVTFNADTRTVVGKKVKYLRLDGKLPAVIYGRNVEPVAITLDLKSTTRALAGLTTSSLMTIEVEGASHTVLVRDRQYDFIRGNLLHIDFLAVTMSETLTATVPIILIGEAPVLAATEAMLITEQEGLSVESLPGDLPESIEVDVTGLESIGDSVVVGDLVISDKVTVMHEPTDTIVVAVGTALEEEEEEEVEEELLLGDTEPEVITARPDEEED